MSEARIPLTAYLDSAVAYLLERLGPGELSHECERLLRMGATSRRRLGVREAASRLGLDRQTLTSMMRRRHGVPGPATLLRWGQVIMAMLVWAADPSTCGRAAAGVSLNDAAAAVGVSSGTDLSQRVHRSTGLYPRDWLVSGACVEALCDALMETWTTAGRTA